jgi:hypothetical protein
MLQQAFGWQDAFAELEAYLQSHAEEDLANRFRDLRDGVNALKHGEGRSHGKLLEKKDALSFEVKEKGQAFFSEGDIAEVNTLINTDDAFLRDCLETIVEIVNKLPQD